MEFIILSDNRIRISVESSALLWHYTKQIINKVRFIIGDRRYKSFTVRDILTLAFPQFIILK